MCKSNNNTQACFENHTTLENIGLDVTESLPVSSDDLSECCAEPVAGAVGDKVGRVGDEWSVVGVELTRLVRSTVVV